MDSLRTVKRRARRDLHDRAKVPALFIAPEGGAPTGISVRVHRTFGEGDAVGSREIGWMTRQIEMAPALIFMRDELTANSLVLKRNVIVSVEVGEAYRVDRLDPPDDITIKAYVTIMPVAETVGLPVPEVSS